jgi:hypothetical protein
MGASDQSLRKKGTRARSASRITGRTFAKPPRRFPPLLHLPLLSLQSGEPRPVPLLGLNELIIEHVHRNYITIVGLHW